LVLIKQEEDAKTNGEVSTKVSNPTTPSKTANPVTQSKVPSPLKAATPAKEVQPPAKAS